MAFLSAFSSAFVSSDKEMVDNPTESKAKQMYQQLNVYFLSTNLDIYIFFWWNTNLDICHKTHLFSFLISNLQTVDQLFSLKLPIDITHLQALLSIIFHTLDAYLRKMLNQLGITHAIWCHV